MKTRGKGKCLSGRGSGSVHLSTLPIPTDLLQRGVNLTDGGGIPLAAYVTAANVPDVNELLVLVDSIGPVGGKPGRPKQRPEVLYGDRAFDSEPHREELRDRGVKPKLAKRNSGHGSGLGVFRWVAERTLAWLHGFRKLRL